MIDLYLLSKAIHIIAFTAWMAGMFYLPRLFVYHSEKNLGSSTYKKFLVMEKKLLKIIMLPSMVLTWVFGSILIVLSNYNIANETWIQLKLILLLFLSGTHGFFSYCYKLFLNNKNRYSSKFYRIVNEIPTLLFVLIVLLAVFRSSI